MKSMAIKRSSGRRMLEIVSIAVFSSLLTSLFILFVFGNKTDIASDEVSADQVMYQHNSGNYSHFCVNKSTPLDSSSARNPFVHAAESSIHSVVNVKTKRMVNRQYSNPLYEFFYGGPLQRREPVEGIGSGVIISKDGYIVTNNHVIAGADEIWVTMNDKREYEAELIGADPSTDIALLKIGDHDLPYIPYGNSDALRIGEWVMAIGNPYNLTSTVTAGIISAKGRDLNILDDQYRIESFIQTDAALNQGNSGGALVNLKGELVGVNTAILSPSGAYSGNSFAVPVSIVKKVVADLIEFGQVQRAILGVVIQDVDAALAKEKGLDKIMGVHVSKVKEDGAAGEAGIETGDVIVQIEGENVNSAAKIQEEVGRFRPGDKIEVKVFRNGKYKSFDVLLTNLYGSVDIIEPDEEFELFGAVFKDLEDKTKEKLNINAGVKVVDVGAGKMAKAGIKNGFIIQKVNNQRINSLNDFSNLLKDASGGILVEGIYPNGIVAYYAFGA
ncbi:MAG: Do family serine endopeptidase [Bacteroidota bacterium]